MSLKPYKRGVAYAATKDIVVRLVDEAGGVKPAAFVLERRERQIYAYCDGDDEAQMNFDQVRRLTVMSGSAVAAEMLAADAGGKFVPGALDPASFAELAARVCGEHGAFATAAFRALSDGRICDDERPGVRRELDDLIRLAVAARTRLDADAAELPPPAPAAPGRKDRTRAR